MHNLLRAVVVALLLAFTLPAQATVTVAALGAPDSGGLYPVVIDNDDMVTYNGGLYAKYETSITSDTITADESGKTFFVQVPETKQVTYTLPTATAGLRYRFVATTGDALTSDYFQLTPESTSKFIAGINSGAGSTFVAGDRIRSPHVTGDTIEIIADDHGNWVVVDMRGTFTDAN